MACTLLTGASELAIDEGSVRNDAAATTEDARAGDTGPTTPGIDASPLPTTDGGKHIDGVDASSPPPPPPPPTENSWCAGLAVQPKSCLDFDQLDLAMLSKSQAGGMLSLDGSGSSAPKSLLAVANDGAFGEAYVRVPTGATPPSTVVWTFDARLDELSPYTEMTELALSYGNAVCAIQPTIDGSSINVNEWCSDPDMQVNHPVATVQAGPGWHSFKVEVDFVTRTLSATVKRPDGVIGQIANITLHPRLKSAIAELRPGITWTPAQTPGSRVRTDNVTLDYQ